MVKRPDGTERPIPCVKVFGEVTEERVRLMREICDAVVAEQGAKRERTRKEAKPRGCSTCETYAPLLAGLRGGSLGLTTGVTAAATAPTAPVAPPPPSPLKVVTEYLAYPRENRAERTLLGR